MKKFLLVLLSLFLILGTFIFEGGSIAAILCVSAFIPVLFGTLITTLFSFSWKEIKEAFQHAFTDDETATGQEACIRDVQLVRSMSGSVMIWAFTIIILALIAILSSVTQIDKLGPHIAVACTALLYAFIFRTVLLFPMETRLQKKIQQTQEIF